MYVCMYLSINVCMYGCMQHVSMCMYARQRVVKLRADKEPTLHALMRFSMISWTKIHINHDQIPLQYTNNFLNTKLSCCESTMKERSENNCAMSVIDFSNSSTSCYKVGISYEGWYQLCWGDLVALFYAFKGRQQEIRKFLVERVSLSAGNNTYVNNIL